jgi:mutator protein MutT
MSEKIGIRAATIVIKDEKLLLVSSKYQEGEFFLFPGGGVEFGETLKEAAIRETFEETGVKVAINDFFHINEYIYAEDWNKRSISIFFTATPIEILEAQTNDNGKIKEVKWIDLRDLDKYDIKPKRIVDLIKLDKLKSEGLEKRYSVDLKDK